MRAEPRHGRAGLLLVFLALVLVLTPSLASAQDRAAGRSLTAARRDDGLKPVRPHCVLVEGACPSVVGPPPRTGPLPVSSPPSPTSARRTSRASFDPEHGSRPLWGETIDVFAGVAFTPRTRYGRRRDGTALVGAAFGNPVRAIGLQLGMAFYSTVDDGFGDRMGLDIELHRALPADLLLTAGWENIVGRGSSDIGSSRYVTVERWIALRPSRSWFSHLAVGLGAGDGRFSTERDWIKGTERWNLIASAALQVARPLLLIAEWPGDDLALSAAIVPSAAFPLVITPGIADLTGSAGDGVRFFVTGTYVLRVRLPF